MRVNARGQGQIKICQPEMEEVDEFRYQVNNISYGEMIEKEISSEIGSTAVTLYSIRKTMQITIL